MMDLKEIIKWFIPCFHILRVKRAKMTIRLTVVCFLFLIFNLRSVSSANLNLSKYDYEYTDDVNDNFNKTKYDINDIYDNFDEDHEDYDNFNYNKYNNDIDNLDYTTEKSLLPFRTGKGIFGHGLGFLFGRTFGRPMKKLAAALIPLVFQIGAASTWAVIAALVGVKTLALTLLILKLLLVAGAAKFGSFIGQKGHVSSGWEAPHGHTQKEIHLHIHNGIHDGTSWNRDGAVSTNEAGEVHINPYGSSTLHGPQTISTPYGNYVKVDGHHGPYL